MRTLPINLYSTPLLTNFIKNKSTAHRLRKLNGDGFTVRVTAPRLVFHPSAAMVDDNIKDVRPLITPFKPSMWGDAFSTFSFDAQVQQNYFEEIEELKKEGRSMLMAAKSTKLLILIDKLERLGLAYHFETEIEDKLKQVYASIDEEEDYNLFTIALRFRLLRQHRYHVSCDVFEKFVEKDNKLKESVSGDVEGLLSLYEASHVRIHDENVLDEAVGFTTHQLRRMQPHVESPLKEKINLALKYPLHKSLGILFVRFHIDNHERDDSSDELVLRLAKLNFNFMQNIFRNEIFEVTKWWKNLNLASKVPYCRDRLIENYMWGLSYHFEPQYSPSRMLINKFYLIATAMDDTYDNYSTLEEIKLFTQALHRWDKDEIDRLPEYIKYVYEGIMKFSEELEGEAKRQGKLYVVPYYIEEMKRAGMGFAKEQMWFLGQESFPSFEEYLVNSRFTGLMYASFVAIVAVLKSATKETIDWVLSEPDVFIYTNDVGRLLDDLATHQRERKDGTVVTPVDYYMKEKGVTMEEAESELRELIEDRWKHMTTAWVNSTKEQQPKEIVVQFLDFLRICGTFYGTGEDDFTYPDKNFTPLVSTLLLDPILI